MATRAFTIVSNYSPPKETLSDDDASNQGDGEVDDSAEQEAVWRTGPLYKSRIAADSPVLVSHRAAFPPNFVPATLTQDDLESLRQNTAPPSSSERKESKKPELGSWYNALRSSQSESAIPSSDSSVSVPPIPPMAVPRVDTSPSISKSINFTPLTSRAHSASRPNPTTSLTSSQSSSKKRKQPPSDWFIQSALSKPPQSTSSTAASSSSSINDILIRNPPPPPNSAQAPVKVRTKIGPGNKGYIMLARKGWQEGEGLGSWRTVQENDPSTDDDRNPSAAYHRNSKGGAKKDRKIIEVNSDGREIIDLTLSDSESEFDSQSGRDEVEEDSIPTGPIVSSPPSTLQPLPPSTEGDRTILLAPLQTYLKSDRLGIGATHIKKHSSSSQPSSTNLSHSSTTSKPKPKSKPFTDTSQAMFTPKELREARRTRRLEHLRESGKSQRKRGSKGFANAAKGEERKRRNLMVYMNT